MKHQQMPNLIEKGIYDAALAVLDSAKDDWARVSVAERIDILAAIKTSLMHQAEGWAEIAARRKLIPAGSPLAGEEWMSGPYAVMAACNGLILTLSQIKKKACLSRLPYRHLGDGQLAVAAEN